MGWFHREPSRGWQTRGRSNHGVIHGLIRGRGRARAVEPFHKSHARMAMATERAVGKSAWDKRRPRRQPSLIRRVVAVLPRLGEPSVQNIYALLSGFRELRLLQNWCGPSHAVRAIAFNMRMLLAMRMSPALWTQGVRRLGRQLADVSRPA